MAALPFLGESPQVTGFGYMMDTGQHHILLEYRIHQGSDRSDDEQEEPLASEPETLNAVVLSNIRVDSSEGREFRVEKTSRSRQMPQLLFCYLVSMMLITVTWAEASVAEEHSGGITDCAALVNDAVRLRCYDRLAERLRGASEVGPPRTEPVTGDSVIPGEELMVTKQVAADADKSAKKDGRWLGIRPYRRNYILPVSYNSRLNREPYEGIAGFQPEDVEIKFQLSFELPVWKDILGQDLDLYFAYTQLSFFQAYNTEYSAPFRDTSYEPEVGLNWEPGMEIMGWRLKSVRLALNHQSNGRTQPLSRSWNRLIGQFQVTRGNLGLGLRLWKRIQEDGANDDNPDITDYLGHGELFTGYDLGRHRFGLMLRNPLEHAALQLDWSYLLNERVRFYVQYFNGYGESLVDYNQQVNRVGVGFLLNEWP